MFKGTAITEHLSRGGDGVAEPSGRSCRLTRDQVAHWHWLLVYKLGMLIIRNKKRQILLVLFPARFVSPWLTDWLTSIVIAPQLTVISTHTSFCMFPAEQRQTCVNSAWGRCPRVCVSQITFTRSCSSRLPAPAPSRYHIKGSGCG